MGDRSHLRRLALALVLAIPLAGIGATAPAAAAGATPPSAPELAAASDTGRSATDNITASTSVSVSGTGAWGSTVQVRDGGGAVLGTGPAGPGASWTNSAPTENYFTVATDGTTWVEVGQYGSIRTSPDGITWTDRASPTTGDLTSVVWVPELGRFFAGGSSARVMSTDGMAWTDIYQSPGAAAMAWSAADGIAVDVSSGGIKSSPDGITRTQRATCPSFTPSRVAYIAQKDLFIVTCASGGLLTSPDGITWTSRTTGTTYYLYSAAYSAQDDLIVVTGDQGTILTSRDGVTWTLRSIGDTTARSSLVYSPIDDLFVASGGAYTTIRTSPDGITWTQRSTGTTMLYGIGYDATQRLWVGAGSYGAVMTSLDGKAWTSRIAPVTPLSMSQDLYHVAYSAADDRWVAVGVNGYVWTSSDGATWAAPTRPATTDLRWVDYSPAQDLFVTVGASGRIYTSPDGLSWTSRTSGTSVYLRAVRWVGGTVGWLAVGDSGAVLRSADAMTWTVGSVGASVMLRDSAWSASDGRFVAVGAAASYTSPDAITWTRSAYAGSDTLNGVAYSAADDRFVASTSTTRAWVSQDGASWTSVTLPGAVWDVTYDPAIDRFIAAGSGRWLLSSDDGLSWTAAANPTAHGLYSVLHSASEGRTVAVGISGSGVDAARIWSPDDGWQATITLPAGTTAVAARTTDGSTWSGDGPALSVTVDTTAPSVSVNQAGAQADPATGLPVDFTVTASEPVDGISVNDLALGGSAGPTAATLSGTGPWTARVTATSAQSGTITVSLPARRVADVAGNANGASSATDGTVTLPPASGDFGWPNEAATVALTAGSGSVSWTELGPVSTRSLQRQIAAVPAPGSCAGATWTADGTATTTVAPVVVAGLLGDRCYRWVLTLNGTVQQVSGSVIVDPVAPSIDITAPAKDATVPLATTGTIVSWTESDGATGIASRSVQRQSGAIVTPGGCDGVTFADDGAPSTTAPPLIVTGLSVGTCVRWAITATDGAGNVAQLTTGSVLLAPPAAVLTAPVAGTTIDGTGATSVTWTETGVVTSRALQQQSAQPVAGGCADVTWADDGPAVGTTSPVSVQGLADGLCHRWVLALGGVPVATSGAVLVDTSAPSIDLLAPVEGGVAPVVAGSLEVSWSAADAVSGIDSWSLQRQSATPVNEACAAVSWADEGTPSTDPSPVSVAGLAGGVCYRWVLTVRDVAGNATAAVSGPALAMAPTVTITAPVAPLTVTDWTYRTVSWIETDRSGTGIVSTAFQRERGTITTPGSCADAVWAPDGAPIDVASPRQDTHLAEGSCYRWTITITDGNGLSGQATSGAVIVDGSSPVVTVTSPASPDLLEATTTSVAWTVTDAVSGTGRSRIQRQKAAPAGGDCDSATWRNDGSAAYATSPVAATLADGSCYRWVVTASDAAGNTASVTSADLLVDLTLKRRPTLAITGHALGRSSDGAVVWMASGSDVTVAVDAGASATVTFSALGPGWSPFGADTQPGGSGGRTYTPDAGAPTTELLVHGTVRGRSTPEASIVLAVDDVAPTARFTGPSDGARGRTTSVTVGWVEGDVGSGVASRSLQRQVAGTVADAGRACSDWSADGEPDTKASPRTATKLPTGCYRWRLTLTDVVGNSDTFTSGSIYLDTTPPHAAFTPVVASAAVEAQGETVAWAVDDALPLRVVITRQRAAAIGGSCAAVTTWIGVPGTLVAIGDGSAEDPSILPGACRRWRLTATDLVGNRRIVYSDPVKVTASGPRADFALPDEWTGAVRSTAPAAVSWREIAASGRIRVRSVQRERSDLVAGACSDAWTADGPAATPARASVATGALPLGACYRWTVTLTDGGGSASWTSGVLVLDDSAPGSRPTLSVVPGSPAVLDGDTLWVRTSAAGSVGIGISADPDVVPGAWDLVTSDTRWRATDVDPSGAADALHALRNLSWAKGAPRATLAVRTRSAAKVAGPAATLDLRPDNAPPTLAIDGVGVDGLDATVRWTAADAAAGLQELRVTRLSAIPASGGACGGADYAVDGDPVLVTGTQRLDAAGLTPGTCYRWRLVAFDRVGNASDPVTTDPAWIAGD